MIYGACLTRHSREWCCDAACDVGGCTSPTRSHRTGCPVPGVGLRSTLGGWRTLHLACAVPPHNDEQRVRRPQIISGLLITRTHMRVQAIHARSLLAVATRRCIERSVSVRAARSGASLVVFANICVLCVRVRACVWCACDIRRQNRNASARCTPQACAHEYAMRTSVAGAHHTHKFSLWQVHIHATCMFD